MNAEDPIKLWQHVHGASVHFPIAMMIASFLFDYGAVIFRKPTWRTVGFWTLIFAAVLSVISCLSGLWGQVGWFGVTPLVTQNPDTSVLKLLGHRNISIAGTVLTVGMAIWRSVRKDNLKTGEFIGYLVLLAITTFAIGYTGWLGAYVRAGY